MKLTINDFIPNKSRMKFTMKYTFVIALLTHMFLILNSLQNPDSMWGTYYVKLNSSDVGRFTLGYLSSLSSYFDLQYFNSLLSIIYLTITVMLLVELTNIEHKWLIVTFSAIYSAFPSISGTLTYSFLTDAYFLSTLLVVLSIYLLRVKSNWLTGCIATILIYISIGTYQSNLAYLITLVLFQIIKDILQNRIELRHYVYSFVVAVTGLFFYVIHFKIYERTHSLTDYQGVNEAGNISIKYFFYAFGKSINSFYMYFLGSANFNNPFEIFNLLSIVFLVVGIVLYLIKKKSTLQGLFIFILLLTLPFSIFLMYFISPNLWYHNLMIQQMVFVYGLLIVIVELYLLERKSIFQSIFSKSGLALLFLVTFNLVIITNIYYEKLETINRQTYSIIAQVVHDIRLIEGFTNEMPLMLVGDPSLALPPIDLYDQKTPPLSVGTGPHIVNSSKKFSNYSMHFIGLQNPPVINEEAILNEHGAKIVEMPEWPSNGYVKVVDDVIIIKFPQ